MHTLKSSSLVPGFLLLVLVLGGDMSLAQTTVKPGFNLFSEEQDVEIGKQSASEVEKQLPILRDNEVQNYVSRIGQRLEQVVPGPRFPYQFKVVNVSDVNAFALPGGYMYINRGLIEAAKDEGELAGVMGHEMAHVALRHGTNQASKAYLGKAGLGVLGGLLGSGTTSDVIGAVGGFGLNSVFLKFSRSAEEQADVVGAQMLAKAGYDPLDMASMFETLREKSGRDPSKFEQFFSSHPAPSDRAKRIEREANLLETRIRPPVGNFRSIQSKLERMPKAPSMQDLASRQGEAGGGAGGGTPETPAGPVSVKIDRPSSRLVNFEQSDGLYQIRHPQNWRAYEGREGASVTLAPEGGIVQHGGQESVVYGMIVSTFDPQSSSRRRMSLEQATEQLTNQLVQGNQYLRQSGGARKISIDGAPGVALVLSGRSPVTDRDEQVVVQTRWLTDNRVLYLLSIAPADEYRQLGTVYERMVSSLSVDERRAADR